MWSLITRLCLFSPVQVLFLPAFSFATRYLILSTVCDIHPLFANNLILQHQNLPCQVIETAHTFTDAISPTYVQASLLIFFHHATEATLIKLIPS
ncbi:hypothetical protein QBC35DRAFT_493307 [Podospora australis]|uniref:Uncharacterized protein n=1 Tax=Podospora australis TaxID=1536484 RepID=A0AAN6WXR1_9PEZI|nr:hypothetical protein QBC35DRAFT_493307 [Podospora australis]